MPGLNLAHLKHLVVAPALAVIGLNSEAAINLVTGTACVESDCSQLKQLGDGPALGLWQMEPATERDIWATYMPYNKPISAAVRMSLLMPGDRVTQLVYNLLYAAAMCRIKYRRSPVPLPTPDDAAGMAAYWKRECNTRLGAGAVDGPHIAAFQAAIDA